MSAGVIKQNGHDATGLCTTALRKREPSKPGLNFNRLDVSQVVGSPRWYNPALQVTGIALFRRIAAPCVALREFDSLEMIGKLSQSGCA